MKKKIPFNIVFAFLFLLLIVVNFTYKSVVYFSSHKYEGTIIGFNTLYSTKNPYIIPTIKFFDENNQQYTLEDYKWAYFIVSDDRGIYREDIGKRVQVLKNRYSNDFEYVTFFNYWLTFYNLVFAFLILVFGVVIIEIIQNLYFRFLF